MPLRDGSINTIISFCLATMILTRNGGVFWDEDLSLIKCVGYDG